MRVFTEKEAQLASLLFKLGAIKLGAFKLKMHEKHPEAPLSPIYLNLRTDKHPVNPGPLTDEAMELIGDLFAETELAIFDAFADIPEAGAPFGDQIRRMVDDRGVSKAERLTLHKLVMPDGTRHITSQVDGEYQDSDVCLLVDDMITQADTKLEAVWALRENGLVVNEILVVVDRGQGGREQLAEAGCKLVPLFTLEELLAFYVEEGFIEQSKADEVLAYIAANRV